MLVTGRPVLGDLIGDRLLHQMWRRSALSSSAPRPRAAPDPRQRARGHLRVREWPTSTTTSTSGSSSSAVSWSGCALRLGLEGASAVDRGQLDPTRGW